MRFRSTIVAIAAIAAIFTLAHPTQATLSGVVSVTGNGGTTAVEVVPNAGDDLTNNGDYGTAGDYYLMQFATSYTFTADYDVEHDGSAGPNINDGSKSVGTIRAGRIANAYLFHSDSDAGGGGTTFVDMTVTFKNPIIGLNGGQDTTNGESHNTSFGLFDNVGVNRFPGGDGFYAFSGGDIVLSISADRRTIRVQSEITNDAGNASGFDQLWVLTAIPEPATATLGLLALGGLGALTRRRRTA